MRRAARASPPGPTLPWTDAATEKKIADAQAAIRRQESRLRRRARAQAARDAAARGRRAARPTTPTPRQAIQRSLDRGLVGYYPFDETAPIPDDQLPTPLPQARLSPPPLAPESLQEPCTSNNGPLVSRRGCRRRFSEAARTAAAAEGRAPRALPAASCARSS